MKLQSFLVTVVFLFCVFTSHSHEADRELGQKFIFDIENLKEQQTSLRKNKSLVIQIPLNDGTTESFVLNQNQLSGNSGLVKTYDGKSGDNRTKIKVSVLNDRVQGIIATTNGYYIFEPVDIDSQTYRIYSLSDVPRNTMVCGVEGHEFADIQEELSRNKRKSDEVSYLPIGDQLRQFRVAAAATGEMTYYFGSQDAALAQVVSIINLANLIYEKELAISFVLINETLNKSIIFPDSGTDPFTPASFASAGQSQIGFNNMNSERILLYNKYDMGHTFHTLPASSSGYSVRGQAGAYPCVDNSKSRGWTEWTYGASLGSIVGVFVHEVGHQFTAEHTYNATGGTMSSPSFCTSGRSTVDAVEPGAGSTLMAYGNNCPYPVNQTLTGDNDLQYFHVKSIEAIQKLLATQSLCYTLKPTGNTPPSANAGNNITIPKLTPFWLNGIASDSDGDELSYTWEQYDVATSNDAGALGLGVGNGGYPATHSTTAPLFRSEKSSATDRTFPKMKFILNNENIPDDREGEALPEVARTMKFRFTVRDNNSGVNSDEIIVSVSDAGPLKVISPNGGETFSANSSLPVTWDVNSTNSISGKVSILLSVDGGLSFPYRLADNVTNNGSYTVNIPNVPNTDQARIKVVAELNMNAQFFDISDADFIISSSCNSYKSKPCFPGNIEAFPNDDAMNLNMNKVGTINAISSYLAEISEVRTAAMFAYTNETSKECIARVGHPSSDTLRFRVTKSGEYTFTNVSGDYLDMMLFDSKSFSCSSLIMSSVYYIATNKLRYWTSVTVNLEECVDYYFIVVDQSKNNKRDVDFSGVGSLYTESDIPSGTDYTYIALDKKDNLIKAQSSTANFTNLPIGEYNILGISFLATLSPNKFIGKALSSLQASECIVVSENSITLKVKDPSGINLDLADVTRNILYPSITKDIVEIKPEYNVTYAQVYDYTGKLCLSTKVYDNKISLKNLVQGIYIIKLSDENNLEYVEKIIKN